MTSRARIEYGMANVVIGQSTISSIDGDRGRLTYRDHPIEDLAHQRYEDVAHLLLRGRWPDSRESLAFRESLDEFRTVPPDLMTLLGGLKERPAGPALATCVAALQDKPGFPAWGLIALGPAIIAAHGALRLGRDFLPPDHDLSIPADSLRRLLGRPLSEVECRAIDTDFVLHADHSSNASTYSARVAASAGSEPVACIVAAMNVFYGIKHGGALETIIDSLDQIGSANPGDVAAFVKRQSGAGIPVAGFGHRVYKTLDPRAPAFLEVAEALSVDRKDRTILDKAEALVQAMKPFMRFKIHPNVDLYAAVVYRLLGLERDQFAPMFAAARISGWLAHIDEQCRNNRPLVPKLNYVGEPPRKLAEASPA